MLLLVLPSARAPARADDLTSLAQRVIQLQKAGRTAEAVAPAERMVALARRQAGRRHPITASALGMLAGLEHALGRYEEAERHFRRALAINEEALGPRHSQTATMLVSLGGLYKTMGRYEEAEDLVTRALAVHQQADGPDHALTASALGTLGTIRYARGRTAEARPLFERALAINRKVFGRNHPIVAAGLSNLGEVHRAEGRHDDAETFFRAAIAANEMSLGRDHPTLATPLNNLAELLHIRGRYSEAESLFRRVIAIEERAFGRDHATLAVSLGNLAGLYRTQGRYDEAESLVRRAVAITEAALGPEHPTIAAILGNLALIRGAQGYGREAGELHERALAVREKALGRNHPDVAVSLNQLAEHRYRQGRPAEAAPLLSRALEIRKAALGDEHYSVAMILGNLALVADERGDDAEAAQLYRRVLAIQEKAFGRDHPAIAITLYNLGLVVDEQGRHSEAAGLLRRALALQEHALGPDHPEVAATLNGIARTQAARKEWHDAYPTFRRATQILVGRALHAAHREQNAASYWERPGTRLERTVYAAEARAAFHLGKQEPERAATLAAEAFVTAQWGIRSEAAAAVARMAARFGQRDDEPARLLRRHQDLAARRRQLDTLLLGALSKPPSQRVPAEEEAWRREAAGAERRLREIESALSRRFPDSLALVAPEPVGVEAVQALLAPDEALYQIVLHRDEAIAWVVTRDTVRWRALPLGAEAVADEVDALRCGLDASRWTSRAGGNQDRGLERASPRTRCKALLGIDAAGRAQPPFDAARAHSLYRVLFAPFEDLIRDRHLLVVPVGPLASLPFQVLVTEPPSPGDSHAETAWLIRRQAVTVLPSVASLKALRAVAGESAAPKAFIGFGNPLLSGPGGSDRRAWEHETCGQRKVVPSSRDRAVRTIGGDAQRFFARGLADVEQIRRQPPLPETADELCAVAAGLDAPAADVFLGSRATEQRLKSASMRGTLRDYRVVHFATHGLLPGETGRVAAQRVEPALMLTPPARPTPEDDGLLTASEVARLSLDANWVVLSACNTAAGRTADAGALSGLARAFFHAGARRLVVSHWYVNSEAAVALVTGMFDALRRRPGLGAAEALRRAMLDRIAAGGPTAHPSYWAPFVLVGEGG